MRSATINLSMPAALLKQIDEEAKTEIRTRSELIREAARTYLSREQTWKVLQRYAGERAGDSGIRTEQDVMRAIASVRRTARVPKS